VHADFRGTIALMLLACLCACGGEREPVATGVLSESNARTYQAACASCHEGQTAFKLTGTTCTRCHLGSK